MRGGGARLEHLCFRKSTVAELSCMTNYCHDFIASLPFDFLSKRWCKSEPSSITDVANSHRVATIKTYISALWVNIKFNNKSQHVYNLTIKNVLQYSEGKSFSRVSAPEATFGVATGIRFEQPKCFHRIEFQLWRSRFSGDKFHHRGLNIWVCYCHSDNSSN